MKRDVFIEFTANDKWYTRFTSLISTIPTNIRICQWLDIQKVIYLSDIYQLLYQLHWVCLLSRVLGFKKNVAFFVFIFLQPFFLTKWYSLLQRNDSVMANKLYKVIYINSIALNA